MVASDRPARATKESKTKTLEHEAQLAAKSDTSTQGIRHPIPTTPPGDPHNAFS